MKFLYKYPQRKFPYEQLVQESLARGREVNEFELLDSDIFEEDRYWDVFIEAIPVHGSHSLLLLTIGPI